MDEYTVYRHILKIRTLARVLKKNLREVSEEEPRSYLSQVKSKSRPKYYANHLCSIKRFFRDYLKTTITDSFEFPKILEQPLILPSKDE